MYKINICFLSLILASCGGGGGDQSQSSSPTPPGGNVNTPTTPDGNVNTPTKKPITELRSENSGVFGTLSGKSFLIFIRIVRSQALIIVNC